MHKQVVHSIQDRLQEPDSKRLLLLKTYLDPIVERYEQAKFIDTDPISILYGFEDPRDQEVIGLFSALLAWGRRDTLLRNLEKLCERMAYKPHAFVYNFQVERDSIKLDGFVHRTFSSHDAIHLSLALRSVLREYQSLEALAGAFVGKQAPDLGAAIEGISGTLLNGPPLLPRRMAKHLARPSSGSACKRICLFLRWMVRSGPVDLGIWPTIDPSLLFLPLDVHSGRQVRAVGLVERKSNDWRAVLELTSVCRELDPTDPARYDFAFFGTGAAGETLTRPLCRLDGAGIR